MLTLTLTQTGVLDWIDDMEVPKHRYGHTTVYTSRPQVFSQSRVQIVPCRSVWAEDGTELAVGVVRQVDLDGLNSRVTRPSSHFRKK